MQESFIHLSLNQENMFGIGAAIGAAGSIAGGIVSSAMMAKARENIQQQLKENQNWYDQRYNEDATQRADAVRLLTMTEESIKKRNKQAAGTQAVMGGTNESVAAEKAANAQSLADTTSKIAAQADARKDAIEQQYMSNKANLNKQLNDTYTQQANSISQAAQGLSGVGSNLL